MEWLVQRNRYLSEGKADEGRFTLRHSMARGMVALL